MNENRSPDVMVLDDEAIGMLRDSARAFAQAEAPLAHSRGLRGSAQGYAPSIWGNMAEQGWLGILIPECYGGSGMGMCAMRVVAEELARTLAPEPLTACAVLARGLILHSQNEELKGNLLSRLAAGNLIAAAATQDASQDGPAGLPMTSVHGEDGRLLLNGAKRFVVPATKSDGYIVSAREDDALALYWLPADRAGIVSDMELRADGSFSQSLRFNAVVLDAGHRLSAGPAALAALDQAFDEAVVIGCAELLGVMDAALSLTLAYMKTRVQFGKPIGSFQALQHRAVDLFIQKELALGAVDDAVRALDAGVSAADRAAVASRAKSRCADAALLITREAIKLHGAIGFADECDIGLYLQRALVLAAWLGNAAWHRRRVDQLIAAQDATRAGPGPAADEVATLASEPVESPLGTDWNAMGDEVFRTEVRSYFEHYYPQHLRYMNRRATWAETRDWALVMSRKGWIAPAWPREHGGMGLSPSKLITYMEEQERWGVARAPDQGILMLGPLLTRFGTPEQQKAYLPGIIACDHIWSQGYSEPNAGSDLANLRTEAIADDAGFVINGSKIWATLAQDATHMFLLARTDKTVKKQDGISFFLLDLKTAGVRIRPIRNIEGHEEFCEVFFDNVRIPRQNLVGEINKGWTIAKTLLGFERLNHGSPRRAQYPLRKIEELARESGLWNDAEFRSKYVKLRLDVDDLASSYARYADIVRSGRNPGPSISFLKIWATETFQRLTELLIEIAGDAGALRGNVSVGAASVNVLGPYYGVFTATIAAGSNEIQRNIIARMVLELPR